MGLLLGFAVPVFGVPVHGSWALLGLLCLVGAVAFSGLGLLVATRAQPIEGVSGLMNLVMLPMWVFSGVCFAWSNFPDVIHPFIRLLPLTALNDGLRAVLLDGAGPLAVGGALAVMVTWGVVSFAISLRFFRWS